MLSVPSVTPDCSFSKVTLPYLDHSGHLNTKQNVRNKHEASLFLVFHSGTRYLITSGITHCLFMSSKRSSKRFYSFNAYNFNAYNFNCNNASFVVSRMVFYICCCRSVFVTAFTVKGLYMNRFKITFGPYILQIA